MHAKLYYEILSFGLFTTHSDAVQYTIHHFMHYDLFVTFFFFASIKNMVYHCDFSNDSYSRPIAIDSRKRSRISGLFAHCSDKYKNQKN